MASSSLACDSYHLVALPYPGRGHINPMLTLCMNLTQRMEDTNNLLNITFIVTEEWLGFLSSDPPLPPNIRYVTIPNVIPSELVRAEDVRSFISAVMTVMAAPCEDVIKQMRLPPDMILSDFFMPWAVEVGKRRSVPVALFWPMSATMFSMFSHFELLKQNGHFPVDLQAMADVRVDYIPGLSPTPLSAFPNATHGEGVKLLEHSLASFSGVSKSRCLLLCSVYDLEPQVVEALKSELQIPMYSIGPSFPHFRLKEIAQSDQLNDDYDYIKWLNKQEPKSVLYVSFGSFCRVSVEQMDEIAAGLVQSGVKFMWVARGNAPRLREICCKDGDGLVVSWCDQLQVLSHSAVGGFWTHCGWSSTQEGLFTGVTFLTFPLLMASDQEANSKMIIEDFKVGWRLKGPAGVDEVVKRDEICGMIRKFMDRKSEEVREMRLRAEELRQRCIRAVDDAGGSYEANFSGFVDFIMSCKNKKQLNGEFNYHT
ncbi:unnamed protein product [Rhodiola kirilowii]